MIFLTLQHFNTIDGLTVCYTCSLCRDTLKFEISFVEREFLLFKYKSTCDLCGGNLFLNYFPTKLPPEPVLKQLTPPVYKSIYPEPPYGKVNLSIRLSGTWSHAIDDDSKIIYLCERCGQTDLKGRINASLFSQDIYRIYNLFPSTCKHCKNMLYNKLIY